MRKHIFIMLAVVLFAGCEEFGPVFTGKYVEPGDERIYTDADFEGMTRTTIAETKEMYELAGGPMTFEEDFYIKGKVTTSDREGNVYREFYIQDETSGIAIKVGKTGLYNMYKLGQEIFVLCKGLTIGDYEGAKQIGYEDITGEYETAYLYVQTIIDSHVLKGELGDCVEPLDLTDHRKTPIFNGTSLKKEYVGKLVKIDALKYAEGIFCLMYVDPNLSHKAQSNRIFLDEHFSDPRYPGGPKDVGRKLMDGTKLRKNWSVDTWAMSKNMCEWYLANGNFDSANIANDDNAQLGSTDESGLEYKDRVKPSAYSMSQYFQMTDYPGKYIAIRSSGYAKFADVKLPDDVLSGSKKITVTAILGIYDGEPQLTLVDLHGLAYSDGTPLYSEM